MADAAHNQHSETRRPSDRDRIVTTGLPGASPAVTGANPIEDVGFTPPEVTQMLPSTSSTSRSDPQSHFSGAQHQIGRWPESIGRGGSGRRNWLKAGRTSAWLRLSQLPSTSVVCSPKSGDGLTARRAEERRGAVSRRTFLASSGDRLCCLPVSGLVIRLECAPSAPAFRTGILRWKLNEHMAGSELRKPRLNVSVSSSNDV
jgi:hypothetical protein